MYNSGRRGKRASDGYGIISQADKFYQTEYPIPVVTSFAVTNGSYVPLDDTAVDTAGGQTIVVYGSGFAPGATVMVGGSTIGAVTYLDQGRLTFTAPANSSGSYTIIVINANGGTGILVPGLVYSGVPTWSTSAGSVGSVYETTNVSSTFVATGDAPMTYSVLSGSLPPGTSLSTTGVLSGSAPVESGSTTYSFTIRATDGQLQDSDRSFSLTVNTDVVSFSSPTNNQVISSYEYTPISNVTVAATSAAGYSAVYSANTVPTGISLNASTGVISGTANTVGNTYTRLTATANTTGRTATRDVVFNVNQDVVTWSSPADATSYNLNGGSAIANVTLAATSAAGKSITYTANALPSGVGISGNVIYGTPDAAQTVTTLLTATAATTNRTATRTIYWTINLGDTYWKNVSLLLNANRPTPAFINDASLNNAQLSIVGDTKPNNFNPYQQGYYSYYFGTKTNYVSVPSTSDITTFTGNFTIESWVYPIDTSIEWIVMDARTNGASATAWLVSLSNYSSGWNLRFYNGTLNDSVGKVQPYVWSHIAVVRVGSTITFYINGVASGTATVSGTITGGTSTVYIGGKDSGLSGYGTVGNISNLRIVNGTAVYTSNFTPPTSPLTAISNTKLLVANSCRHIDSSVNNATLTNSGTVVSAAHPFTTTTTAAYNTLYSTYFDGSGDYLSIADNANFEIGLNVDFTIEAWFNIVSLPSSGNFADIFTKGASGVYQPYYLFVNASGSLLYYSSSTGSSWDIASAVSFGTISLSTWYHVAVSRQGTNTRLFLNGALINTIASSGAALYDNTRAVAIGGRSDGTETQLVGAISNVRFVKGTAIYTAAFTPPTTSLTAVANTVLLTCQNSTFIDNSTNAFTITSNGDAKPIALSPFTMTTNTNTLTNLGSAYFDGSGDYITAADSNAYSFGTGDFTIEAWIYITTGGRGNGIWTNGTAASGSLGLTVTSSNTLRLDYYGGTGLASTGTVAIGQWQHVAAVRSGSNLYLYINGVRDGSTTTDSNNTSNKSAIGDNWYGYNTSSTMTGYITDLRITKGTALYNSNFLPPQTPLTAVANTQLLTCQTNGGATNNGFVDQSSFNNIITRNGNTTQGTFSPYSQTGWSTYFNGSSDYQYLPTNAAFAIGTADFTLEMWVMPTGPNQGWTTLFAGVNYGASSDWGLYGGDSTNALYPMFFFTSSSSQGNGSSQTQGNQSLTGYTRMTIGQWNHIAVSRVSGTARMFLNGTQTGPSVNASTWSLTNSLSKGIGGGYNGNGNTLFTGYISNIRLLSGTGLYSANFTPPTTPLAPIANTVILTCQSNRFIDVGPNNFTITSGGTPRTQAISPFGGTTSVPTSYSNYFDGSGDYFDVGLSSLSGYSGDVTIECWFYLTGTPSGTLYNTSYYILGAGPGASNPGTDFAIGSTAIWFNQADYTSRTLSGNWTINYDWNHIAITRSGNNWTMWLNGTSIATATSSAAFATITNAAVSKAEPTGGEAAGYMNGYISNLRVVKSALYTSTFTPPTSPLTAIANTILLTCQSSTLIDNSTNRSTITAYGDTKPRPFNPFGLTNTSMVSYSPSVIGGSMYFDGTGDYLYTPSLTLGGNFTIELWYYYSSGGLYRSFVTTRNSTSDETGSTAASAVFLGLNGNSLYYDSYNTQLTGSGTVVQNAWNHIACVRSGSTVTLYLNGVSQGTVFDATTKTARPVYVGGLGSIYNLIGYISDFKMTPGVALYTANFYPGIAPVTPTSTISANTYSSGLYLTGTSGGIIDAHGTNNLETVGNTQLASEDPYGGSYYSNYFDGSGDYLSVPNNTAFNLGSGNFTMECWVNYNALPSSGSIYSFGGLWNSNTNYSHLLGLNNNSGTYRINLYYALSGTSVSLLTIGNWTPTIGTWYHVAIVRSGSTLSAYINGTSIGSVSLTDTFYTSSTIYTVGSAGGDGHHINGIISNFRLVKGTAVYTTNFTPPTSPLTSISGTSLLTCQSNTFKDNSTNGFTITRNGDVLVKSFNPFQQNTGKSLYFDGTDDLLILPDNPTLKISSGDYTVEGWFYTTNASNIQTLIWLGGNTSAYSAIRLGISSGAINLYVADGGGSWGINSGGIGTVVAGQWYHIAVCRSTNDFKVFLNGTQIGTTYTLSTVYATGTLNYIGALNNAAGGSAIYRTMYGYIKDVRLTKGIARYTTTFTPPTTTFEVK